MVEKSACIAVSRRIKGRRHTGWADKKKRAGKDVTKFWKKLQSPFALVAQGFVAGGLVFFTTRADASALLSGINLPF
jgi:hypothetical protein